MAKNSRTKAIFNELLVGGNTFQEIADRVAVLYPEVDKQKLYWQVKVVYCRVKKYRIKGYSDYKVADTGIKVIRTTPQEPSTANETI